MGGTKIYRKCSDNPHHLKGYQVVCRQYAGKMLIVFHSFADGAGEERISLPNGKWKIIEEYGEGVKIRIENQKMELIFNNDWNSYAVMLESEEQE